MSLHTLGLRLAASAVLSPAGGRELVGFEPAQTERLCLADTSADDMPLAERLVC